MKLSIPDIGMTANESMTRGVGTLLVTIRRWNHQDNDPQIDVVVTQSVFGTPGTPDGGVPDVAIDGSVGTLPDGGMLPYPAWDGNDWFWARTDNFLGGDMSRPLVEDDNAYVANRQMVVTLPDGVQQILSSDAMAGLLVKMTDAHSVGTISADESRLTNAIVAGRWSLIDLLATSNSLGVCSGSIQFAILSAQLNRFADVRRTPGTGGPGVKCDAVSIGVEYTGYRGRVAGVALGRPLSDQCSDGGVPDGG